MVVIYGDMKYPADQKAATHERIIDTASEAFRRRGFEGVGIADLMQESGLTPGGFYRHFDSKEDLYTKAVTRGQGQMADQLVKVAKSAPAGRAIHAIVAFYLSVGHLESVGSGCVIAALAPEFNRRTAPVRSEIDFTVESLMQRLSPHFTGKTQAEKRRSAFLLISGMAGVLMTARAMTDRKTQKDLLDSARAFYTSAFADNRVH